MRKWVSTAERDRGRELTVLSSVRSWVMTEFCGQLDWTEKDQRHRESSTSLCVPLRPVLEKIYHKALQCCTRSVLTAVCSQTRCRGWITVGNLMAARTMAFFSCMPGINAFLAMGLQLVLGKVLLGPFLCLCLLPARKWLELCSLELLKSNSHSC